MSKRDNRKMKDEVGPASAGQSGDLQQLSDVADADSESVDELLEEGNAFEAEAVQGVEDAKPPDVSEVTTRDVPEDDVPAEYLNNDKTQPERNAGGARQNKEAHHGCCHKSAKYEKAG